MSSEQVGLIGGIAGGVLGVPGGGVGTYFSIKNTDGPRERAFLVHCSLAMGLVLAAMLTVAFMLPAGWRFVGLAPLLLMGPIIPRLNRVQQRIREEEAPARRTGEPAAS